MSATYFRVRNWDNFQHYKNRNPPWIKLHFALLASEDWVMFDDASRVLAIACMLIASRNEGRVPNKPDYVRRVAYLNASPDFGPLVECGFLEEVQADASTMLADASDSVSVSKNIDTTPTVQEEASPRASGSEPSWRIEFDMMFWPAYPHKVGRPKALAAFLEARQNTELDVIMAGLDRYVREKPPDRQYLNPANFLSEERWADEPAKRDDTPAKKPSSTERALASLGRLRSQVAPAGHAADRGGGRGSSVVAIYPDRPPLDRPA